RRVLFRSCEARLQQLVQVVRCQLRLLENIGKSSFCESRVLRHNCAENLVTDSFFERNVAALLSQDYEPAAFERPNKPLAGNAGQPRHVTLRSRRTSKKVAAISYLIRGARPRSQDKARWLPANSPGPIQRPCLATSHRVPDSGPRTNRLLW